MKKLISMTSILAAGTLAMNATALTDAVCSKKAINFKIQQVFQAWVLAIFRIRFF